MRRTSAIGCQLCMFRVCVLSQTTSRVCLGWRARSIRCQFCRLLSAVGDWLAVHRLNGMLK